MASLVGLTLGNYRVVAKLGRGGMAEVYKAYQPGLERYVAIKVMHSHLVEDEDFVGRFNREALATGRLRHSNIVQALDFGQDNTYYMVMEFIDGPTLKSELKARHVQNKPFTFKEVARIFTALCSAIDYAHARGMVHRDLKPANIMINEEGQVVLTDFGIARIVGATQYTQTGALSGTPAYMSPEQGQGERGDERSDIYALGVILYEMVTGSVPYDADTPFAVIMKHISAPLPLPTTVNPDIPEKIEQVILKAMSKDPDDRYQTAGEMAQALRDAVGLTPGDNLDKNPLSIVAPPLEVDQIDHPTGPITDAERQATVVGGGAATTMPSGSGGATIPSTASSGGIPMAPLVVGGIIILLLIGGGIFFVMSAVNGDDPEVTTTSSAVLAQNNTPTPSQNATDTPTVPPPVRTETAVAEMTAAAAEQEALIESVLGARDATSAAQRENELATAAAEVESENATATAEVEAQAAAAETGTAETLANATSTPTVTNTRPPTNTPTPGPPTDTPTPVPTPTPEGPSLGDLSGRLAFPVDDGAGHYDVYIVSVPGGDRIAVIRGARQPDFRADGAKLLVNAQGGNFGENVFQFTATGNLERAVSSSPTDSYPVYNPGGDRIAYSNPQLTIGADGSYHSYLFVQCSLLPPEQEPDQTCQDVPRFGVLVPNGQIGEVQGSNPVWTSDDRIAFKGCNSWRGGGSCGIYASVSWGNKRGGNGSDPVMLADGSSLIPTDTQGNLLAYHSRETGNWEAYVMNLDGSGQTNISNSSNSSDGLPTISPDGEWVAFASDRDGRWAVYVAPSNGRGEAVKMFDFPKANPWATGDRDWTAERMSWGAS